MAKDSLEVHHNFDSLDTNAFGLKGIDAGHEPKSSMMATTQHSRLNQESKKKFVFLL